MFDVALLCEVSPRHASSTDFKEIGTDFTLERISRR
jgi:hypothetical protein